jgi:uncharacterized protein (DUF58 family)
MLDALRGVRWPARHPVPPGSPGAHRSRRLGAAVEFTEYRPYRYGDDPRRLDWKLLARTDRAYIRLTDDHAVLPTTILIDASASMAYPTATLDKWRLAVSLAIGFAAVAQASGDPVGLHVMSGDQVMHEVPRTTRRGIGSAVASALGAMTPGEPRRGARPRTQPLTGRLVFIGDFLQGPDVMVPPRGEAYALHVVAREELDPPRKALLVSDPEDDTFRRPLLRETRSAYLDAFGAWRSALRMAWRAAGAEYRLVTTDDRADRVIRSVVRM